MDVSELAGIENIPLLRTLGITVREIGERHSEMEVEVAAMHGNYLGGAHGGLTAALMDTACFFPLPLLPSGRLATTTNLTVNYVRSAAIGERLVARADLLHLGRRTASLSVKVTNDRQQLIAHGTATLLIIKEPE